MGKAASTQDEGCERKGQTETPESVEPASPTALPGEPFDIGFPRAGDILGVVGVTFDEVLNLRALPGAREETLAALDPTADDLKATGRSRLVDELIWTEVTVESVTGWVNQSLVAYIGSTADITSQATAMFGDTPAAVEELGLVIAESMASEDPPSTITMTVAPTAGKPAEVTYDVLGLGDDSLLGYRLVISAERDPGQDRVVLKSVERTILCMRGVTGDRLCI